MNYFPAVLLLIGLAGCGEPVRGPETVEGTYVFTDQVGTITMTIKPGGFVEETEDGKTTSLTSEGPLVQVDSKDGGTRFFQVEPNGDLRLVMTISESGDRKLMQPDEQFLYKREK